MGPHRLICGTLACTLACCFWLHSGFADEPKTSWTAKLWPGSWVSKRGPEGKKDGRGTPVAEAKVDVDAAVRLRAELDWKRRAEVCQKLRQIAFETNNDELDRFAERLDQRAWDIYVKRTGNPTPGLSTDERILAERIGVDFELLTPSTKKQPARAETQREEP